MDMSWERLSLLSEAHRQREALTMLQFMIAAQGNDESWTSQFDRLKKILKH